jgi:hypothetical protein
MSSDEAKEKSADAPVKLEVAQAFVNVDPRPVTDTLNHISGRVKGQS